MPLTNLDDLRFNVKADSELAGELEEHTPYPMSLTLSLSYRSVAPELSAA
jgi:hypothetical protein